MPHILLIRHAAAADADTSIRGDDRERPLTAAGIDEFRRFLSKVKEGLPVPTKLYSSPLRRAWETTQLLIEELGWPEAARHAVLEPGISTPAVVSFLQQNSTTACLAIVGHEPDLHRAVACLSTGHVERPVVEFQKGAICELVYDRRIEPGSATIRRLLQPR